MAWLKKGSEYGNYNDNVEDIAKAALKIHDFEKRKLFIAEQIKDNPYTVNPDDIEEVVMDYKSKHPEYLPQENFRNHNLNDWQQEAIKIIDSDVWDKMDSLEAANYDRHKFYHEDVDRKEACIHKQEGLVPGPLACDLCQDNAGSEERPHPNCKCDI